MKISLVVPCYNEEGNLPLFYTEAERVHEIMKKNNVSFEYVFIDDGSTDLTLTKIRTLSKSANNIHYISFSRNFGKEAAIYAGLSHATGDYVVCLDADLQHPPEKIIDMWQELKNGEYDSVGFRRISRQGEPVIRSFFSRCFYKIIRKISSVKIVDGATDFRIMSKAMVNAILSMKEYNRFSKGLDEWVGFRTKWLEYVNVERTVGQTKWSFWGLVRYAIEGIVSFSTVPLVLAAFFGIVFCFLSFVGGGYVVLKKLLYGDPVQGYATIASLVLFLGGLELLCLGVLGQYFAKIYMEVKKRPIYISKEEK